MKLSRESAIIIVLALMVLITGIIHLFAGGKACSSGFCSGQIVCPAEGNTPAR